MTEGYDMDFLSSYVYAEGEVILIGEMDSITDL